MLIPNTLISFFSPRSQSCPFRAGILPFWCSTGPGASIRGQALSFEIYGSPAGGITGRGMYARPHRIVGRGRGGARYVVPSALHICFFCILIPNTLSSFFSPRSQSCPFRAGILPFWCSTGLGACIRGRALFQAAHSRRITGPVGRGMSSIRICRSFFSTLVSIVSNPFLILFALVPTISFSVQTSRPTEAGAG